MAIFTELIDRINLDGRESVEQSGPTAQGRGSKASINQITELKLKRILTGVQLRGNGTIEQCQVHARSHLEEKSKKKKKKSLDLTIEPLRKNRRKKIHEL